MTLPTFRSTRITVVTLLALALTGTFAVLAQVSAISRLIVYVTTCAATLRLRDARFRRDVAQPVFVTPLGPVVPMARK